MDEQVEVKDYVNMDPNEAYTHNNTWDEVLQQHRDAGYTDSQIVNKFDNSNWVNGEKYQEWRNKLDANHANFIAGLNTDKANQVFNPKPNNIGDFSNNIATNNDMFKPGNNAGGEEYDVNSNFDESGRIKELREQFSNNDEFRQAAKDEGIELAAKGSMMNIQEAYLNGHINKGERNYLILDAIQTAMSNAGNALMNIAAAYTGGSGNNPTNQKAMWQDRMKGVNEAQTTSMQRNVQDSEMEAKKRQEAANATNTELQNRKMELQQIPAERFMSDAASLREKAKNDPQHAADYEAAARLIELVGSASTEGIDAEEYIAAFAASTPGGLDLIKELAGAGSEVAKAIAGLAGAVNTGIITPLANLMNGDASPSVVQAQQAGQKAGQPTFGDLPKKETIAALSKLFDEFPKLKEEYPKGASSMWASNYNWISGMNEAALRQLLKDNGYDVASAPKEGA